MGGQLEQKASLERFLARTTHKAPLPAREWLAKPTSGPVMFPAFEGLGAKCEVSWESVSSAFLPLTPSQERAARLVDEGPRVREAFLAAALEHQRAFAPSRKTTCR